MLDHKEAIQELEGQRGHCEEIEGDDCLAMIGEERANVWPDDPGAAAGGGDIGDSAFADREAKLQNFPMDPGCTPVCIFQRYTEDQVRISALTS